MIKRNLVHTCSYSPILFLRAVFMYITNISIQQWQCYFQLLICTFTLQGSLQRKLQNVFGRIFSKTEGRKKPMQKKNNKITDSVKIHRMFQKFLACEKDQQSFEKPTDFPAPNILENVVSNVIYRNRKVLIHTQFYSSNLMYSINF